MKVVIRSFNAEVNGKPPQATRLFMRGKVAKSTERSQCLVAESFSNSAGLITAGGLYDLLPPQLAANLVRMTGEKENAQKLVRELLRALGGALVAIGVAAEFLVVTSGTHRDLSTSY